MPRRNLHIILIAAIIAMLCHGQAQSRHGRALSQAFGLISDRYVEELDEQELFVAAIEAMTDTLDRHSRYFSAEDFDHFREQLDKSFTGIGISVTVDPETERLTVISPLLGSPALEAGMRAGDVILTVDGEEIAGLDLNEMVDQLKGEPGSFVKLSVLHEGADEPVTMSIRRASVLADSVLGDTRNADGSWNFHLEEDPRIGYIRVDTFGDHTLEEFRAALESLEKEPVEAILLDLRGNGGGRLDVAVPLCDMFVDAGGEYDGMIVSTKGRGDIIREAYRAHNANTIVPRDLPVAMLVDGGSASASEIFAACLQDYGRAVIVGDRTYGKGTVQELIPLADGESELKLTTATYHRPNGENIDKDIAELAEGAAREVWGVSPNAGFTVELTDEQHQATRLWRQMRDVIRFTEDGRTIAPSGLLPEDDEAEEEVSLEVEEEPADEAAEPGEEVEIEAGPSVPPPVPPPTGHPDPQLERAVEYLQGEIEKDT